MNRRRNFFQPVNKTLGEGIARLLSTQILAGRLEEQKQLLTQSELKLLQAQVNPHFLFNTLNTLAAVVGKNPQLARQLVQNFSTVFRKNLKRGGEEVTLEDEMEHVAAYLNIEKARYSGCLTVSIDIPEEFLLVMLPAFSLQPIVENAVKHGTSQLVGTGEIRIHAKREGSDLLLSVEDNAGLFDADAIEGGLGMMLVERRLRNRFGPEYVIDVVSDRDAFTRVTLRVPMGAQQK